MVFQIFINVQCHRDKSSRREHRDCFQPTDRAVGYIKKINICRSDKFGGGYLDRISLCTFFRYTNITILSGTPKFRPHFFAVFFSNSSSIFQNIGKTSVSSPAFRAKCDREVSRRSVRLRSGNGLPGNRQRLAWKKDRTAQKARGIRIGDRDRSDSTVPIGTALTPGSVLSSGSIYAIQFSLTLFNPAPIHFCPSSLLPRFSSAARFSHPVSGAAAGLRGGVWAPRERPFRCGNSGDPPRGRSPSVRYVRHCGRWPPPTADRGSNAAPRAEMNG